MKLRDGRGREGGGGGGGGGGMGREREGEGWGGGAVESRKREISKKRNGEGERIEKRGSNCMWFLVGCVHTKWETFRVGKLSKSCGWGAIYRGGT